MRGFGRFSFTTLTHVEEVAPDVTKAQRIMNSFQQKKRVTSSL
jgi:hypothetical protein